MTAVQIVPDVRKRFERSEAVERLEPFELLKWKKNTHGRFKNMA